MQFSNICLTTDFSTNCTAVIPFAVDLAKKFNGIIWYVHVFDGMYLIEAAAEAGEGHFPNPSHWIDPLYNKLGTKLREEAIALSAAHGVHFNPVMLRGNAVVEIVKLIKKENMDCLMLTTHGRTGVAHFLFGSTAERLVRFSPCPVLTVRPHPHEHESKPSA